MSDFYSQHLANSGVNYGAVLIQAGTTVGGARSVFVKLQGQGKNGLVFPPIGGLVKNPFKGHAKAFAGDLAEYRTDGSVYLLKTYELAEAASTTEVKIVRDGFHHKPFVGDILMVEPDKLTATGTGVTVTAVKADGDVWVLTVSAALTGAKGAVLVEAEKAGSGAKAVVTNPNAFLPCDVDFLYNPQESDDDFEGARYPLTPCLANEDTKLYISKMSPLPKAIKAINASRVDGWFNL